MINARSGPIEETEPISIVRAVPVFEGSGPHMLPPADPVRSGPLGLILLLRLSMIPDYHQ